MAEVQPSTPLLHLIQVSLPMSLPQQGHHLTLKLPAWCGTQMSAPSLWFQSYGFFLLTGHLETLSVLKFLLFWQSLKSWMSLAPQSIAKNLLGVSSSFLLCPNGLSIHWTWCHNAQVRRHSKWRCLLLLVPWIRHCCNLESFPPLCALTEYIETLVSEMRMSDGFLTCGMSQLLSILLGKYF